MLHYMQRFREMLQSVCLFLGQTLFAAKWLILV